MGAIFWLHNKAAGNKTQIGSIGKTVIQGAFDALESFDVREVFGICISMFDVFILEFCFGIPNGLAV